jgi:hypothetical protein
LSSIHWNSYEAVSYLFHLMVRLPHRRNI